MFQANIENIVAEAKRYEEEDYEFQMLILTWAEFERQIYRIKHSTEDDKSVIFLLLVRKLVHD